MSVFGLVLSAGGCFVLGAVVALLVLGVVVRRIERRGRWARADAVLEEWREKRRRDRAAEASAWKRDFAALLPRPEPVPVPCDGSNHRHIDDVRLGSREVRVICVPDAPKSTGGFVLAPGERVIVPGERAAFQAKLAHEVALGGITVDEALRAMRRFAR